MHRILIVCTLVVSASLAFSAESPPRGSLSGVVTNQATGAFLQDATVEIPVLNRSLLTDELGRFQLFSIPLGTYEITVSYLGLDTQKQTVTLTEESPGASLDFPLTAEVYQLETFVVSGEREGTAAALTRQRTSDNVKSVVSMDAMGILANENPGELLAQLAGVAGIADDSGDIVTVNIRGIDSSMSSVTYDGAQMATSYGTTSRSFRFLNINASTFEELEVIKALTPNLSAASLGGTVNMKTKSTLNMKKDLEISYRATLRYTPSFFDYVPRRKDHPFGPLFSLDYRQVFSVGGGHRNLGVYVNLFHTSRIDSMARTQLDYTPPNNPGDPSLLYYYRATDNANTKYNDSATLRFDYKVSDRSRLYLTALYSQQREWVKPGMELVDTTYSANTTGAGSGVDLGNVTSVSPTRSEISNGTMSTTQGYIGFFDAQYRAQFGGEHLFNRFEINYDLSYSRSDVKLDGNKGDYFAGWSVLSALTSMGAIIDFTENIEYPYFTQTSGSDMSNLNNYSNTRIRHRSGTRKGENIEGKLDLKTNIAVLETPVQISAGLAYRSQFLGTKTPTESYTLNRSASRAASFAQDIELDPRFGPTVTGIPRFNIGTMVKDYLDTPGDWILNIGTRIYDKGIWQKTHANYYSDFYDYHQGTQDLNEDIYAVYLMGKTKIKKLGILAGVRLEYTKAQGSGWERKKYTGSQGNYFDPNSSDPEKSDPYLSARNRIYDEYGDRMSVKRSYHDIFPSLHFTYSFHRNLLGRASLSTAIGRPEPREMIPGINVNTNNRTVYRRNPDLIPQYALNYDLALEYYLPSASVFSVGVFRKDISDFMYTSAGDMITVSKYPELGNEWTGYFLTQKFNGKKATVEGLEISYNHLLRFLPSPFKWTRLTLSYTLLRTEGDYGENGSQLSTKDVQGFIPQTFSARLNYSYKNFGMTLSALWQDDYIQTYSPQEDMSIYRKSRISVNASAYWRFTPWLTLDLAVNNIFDEPWVDYRGTKERRYRTNYAGPYATIGLSGRF